MPTKDGRSDAIDFLKKKMGHAFEPLEKVTGISSGCLAVDYVVGNGGFPRGRVSEIFGLEQSGKSTVGIAACAKAQSMGFYPVYIDAERGLDKEHAARLGFDVTNKKKGLYLLPNTLEETMQITDTLAQEANADLIIVDSVPALVPESLMKGDIAEMGQYGQVARLLAGTLPRLTKIIERTKTAVVFINQLRANISASAYTSWNDPKEKSFGGYALRYFSSVRINLRQKNKKARTRTVAHPTEPGKTQEISVASLHTVACFKSKVSQPYKESEFQIRYDPVHDLWGIDNLHTILRMAMTQGIIETKGGGVYVYTGSERVAARGEDNLYDWFSTHADDIVALRGKLGV